MCKRTGHELLEELLERWRRGGLRNGKGGVEIGIWVPLLPRKNENPTLKVCYSTLPLTSVINSRKSHSRHTGKTDSQPVLLSCQGFLFYLAEVLNTRPINVPQKKNEPVGAASSSSFCFFVTVGVAISV